MQTRLDLWLKTHIEKVLAPLFSLAAAEDLTGMARGVAFQIVEALGVLERQKVQQEVKGLDQPARASLRKYGVRFGAYHIYLPNLLKPAPRSLATHLWALKHGGPEAKGLTDLLHLAASGRTSIPVDKDVQKTLYRTAGYRVTGERAVRVDILERLADLIRPALAWREGATGEKPAGAFDGRGFTVTGAMTSLTGASGEDFASILRSLGYRMDRKPKPGEAAAVPAAEGAIPATEAVAADAQPAEVPAAEATVIPEQPAEPAAEKPAEAATETAAAGEQKAEAAAKPADDGMIEVWRPGGRSDHKRPRHRRPQRQPQVQTAAAPATNGEQAPATAETGEAKPAEEARRTQAERDEKQARADRRERQERQERDQRRVERKTGEGRDDRPRRRDRGPQVDRAEREQYYAKPLGNRTQRRDQADPNSPFAKLAALKQQLEQSTKEPS